MSGLPVGQLLNAAIDRSRKQHRLEPPVATFPVFRIVFNIGTRKYKAVKLGVLSATQTHRKISAQKFGENKNITAESFELLCSSEGEASSWRDRDIVRAALEWCRANEPRGHAINVVNDALLVVLLAAHGAPATGVRGDFDLHHAGSHMEMKPVSAVENKAVENSAVEVEQAGAAA